MMIRKKNLFIIIIIGFLIIIFHYFKIINPLEGVIIKVFNPIRKRVYNISRNFRDYFYVFTHYSSIRKENILLKENLISHAIDLSHLKRIEEENLVLKQALNYSTTVKRKMLLAEVVSGFYLDGDNLLVINKGSKDGIDIGMPVIFASGIIVGKIVGLSDYSANVLLLSDKNSLITATIQGDSQVKGIVKGDVDYSLEMNYIPPELDIKVGDIVVSSGLEEKIPRNLVIGQVKEVIFNDEDFFKTAIVYSLVDYQSISFVSVILD